MADLPARLAVTITVRFDDDEASQLRALAKSRGTTYPELMRQAVRALIHPDLSAGTGTWSTEVALTLLDEEGR